MFFIAGNRVGKTYEHGVVTIEHSYGYRVSEVPDLKPLPSTGDYPPRENIPPEYWIRRPDGVPLTMPTRHLSVSGLSLERGIGAILWPTIERFIPPVIQKQLSIAKGSLGVPIRVAFPDGRVIRFGSELQGSFAFEGDQYTSVGVDEPISKAVWTSIWRGMTDHYAPFWWTFTPLGDYAPWVYRQFILEKRENVGVVYADQRDNPYLSDEALSEFEQGVEFSEEEEQARRHGRFGFLTHRAFPTFDPAVHVIEPPSLPLSWPRILACDPANRRPFFFTWLAWDAKRDTWIVYREYPHGVPYQSIRQSTFSPLDYATMIRNMEGDEKIYNRKIDPKFGVAEYAIKGQKQTSVVDDFARYGMHFDPRVPGSSRIETGILQLRTLLAYDTQRPIDHFNHPHLLVSAECQNVIDAFMNYSFVPPNARDDSVLEEEFLEAFKDPIDCLRYAVADGPPVGQLNRQTSYISDRVFAEANNRRNWRIRRRRSL